MGCGNGFYTLKLARLTGPKGKVYAVDIQQEMLDLLAPRPRSEDREHRAGAGKRRRPAAPANSLDLVLMVNVYHEFSQPAAMLKAIRKSLKPRGRIALVEFRAEDPDVPIKPLHKMSKKQILKELPGNGFTLSSQFDGLPWQHLMFFKPGDPPAGKDRERLSRKLEEPMAAALTISVYDSISATTPAAMARSC